ncbi:MAG: hypothetical protein ABR958_03790 [Dehalococcoidales bacterium]|jgi:hypothetical protein
MSSSLAEKLDALAAAFSNIKFSSCSNLDAFTFKVSRENHSVIFKHGELEVKVGNFKLMDGNEWFQKEPKAMPVIDDYARCRRLWYEADVKFSVGKIKNSKSLPLGYATYRDSLVAPLGTMPERMVINDLLFKIEQWLASTFGEELFSPQISKNTVRDMDSRSDSLGRRIIRALGLS